jgi:hypothetical protein
MLDKDWLLMHALAWWGMLWKGDPICWTEYRVSWN